MTDRSKPEALTDAELDSVEGGVSMLLPAVQAAREASRADAFFDEADALKHKSTAKHGGTRIVAEGGGSDI